MRFEQVKTIVEEVRLSKGKLERRVTVRGLNDFLKILKKYSLSNMLASFERLKWYEQLESYEIEFLKDVFFKDIIVYDIDSNEQIEFEVELYDNSYLLFNNWCEQHDYDFDLYVRIVKDIQKIWDIYDKYVNLEIETNKLYVFDGEESHMPLENIYEGGEEDL